MEVEEAYGIVVKDPRWIHILVVFDIEK